MFYGPVLSRRFGYSLGIDLIPLKVCVYDCIYCQLGKTTKKTIERKKYLDINFKEFKTELNRRIKNCLYLNYITFSGSGEPTLNSDIGKLIEIIKKNYNIPVAVLTSGATLGFEGVIDDIKEADLIKVSLDAPHSELLEEINRPPAEVNFYKNVEGLKELIKKFSGDIWIEIMVLKGRNDDINLAYMFKNIIDYLGDGIKKVHLNTPIRSMDKYNITSEKRLKEIKSILGQKAYIIKEIDHKKYKGYLEDTEKEILELIKRRPIGVKDITSSLGLNLNETIKIINKLQSSGKIKKVSYNYKEYYILQKE